MYVQIHRSRSDLSLLDTWTYLDHITPRFLRAELLPWGRAGRQDKQTRMMKDKND